MYVYIFIIYIDFYRLIASPALNESKSKGNKSKSEFESSANSPSLSPSKSPLSFRQVQV